MKGWLPVLSLVAGFLLGFLLRAGIGNERVGFSYGSGVQVAAKKAQEFEAEINKKSEYIKELEEKISKGTSASSTLNEELQKTRFVTGLTESVGPGIVVTLLDSRKAPVAPVDQFQQKNLIHDVDILYVVNELKATGAEAISVNGQRIVTASAVRCVGPVVHVNSVPVAPAYVVQAIGDPDTLFNGLNIQNGVLDELRRYDPAMVRIEKKSKLHLPAFAGSTQMRHSRPPSEPSHSSKDKNK